MAVIIAYLIQYTLQPTSNKCTRFKELGRTQNNVFRVKKMLYLNRRCFGCVRCSQKQVNPRQLVGLPKSVDWSQEQLNRDENNDTKTLPCARSLIISEPWLNKRFVVLGIETSCDDTGVAIVDSSGRILGETRVGQEAIHSKWGGVVPALARDAHDEAITRCIDGCLKQANLSVSQLDAIAVTMGPGLELCLRVGFESGRNVAASYHLPFVSIHHLEAHCLMARLFFEDITFPFLNVLVSGGHCQLILCKGVGEFLVLGGTLDDAMGEAYDKVARLLGLASGGGGGALVEQLAKDGNADAFHLPVPMSKTKDMNFSFAGLKTAVSLLVRDLGGTEILKECPQLRSDVAASFQKVCYLHLHEKTQRALEWCIENEKNTKYLVLSGGVARNESIRSCCQQLAEKFRLQFAVAPPEWCTDNGVMTAWAGIERLRLGIQDDMKEIDVQARWPIGKFYQGLQ
ncbi:hypothetical protein GpartN1_g3660.t1 [Galdieria partita]|uniref:N(6)-L-threonylcarbamoyladenine synthase n=1 Tax=Galdieria partita TaxID=83374 RepID=A0A9C7PX89_9RHOD|nr:hypothetical protein GpartN1_g3660.t1 [Galdieria partita]